MCVALCEKTVRVGVREPFLIYLTPDVLMYEFGAVIDIVFVVPLFNL